MATVIDGTTLNGYWKLYDDGTPSDFVQVPKESMFFKSFGVDFGRFYFVSDYTSSAHIASITTSTDTVDGNGNLLDTSAKICEYLSNLK